MRLLGNGSLELPSPVVGKDKRDRRLLTSRAALLTPLQKISSRLRRPGVLAALGFCVFCGWVLIRHEGSRATTTFAAKRTPPPTETVAPTRRTGYPRTRMIDKRLLHYDGLGGMYMGADQAVEPSFLEPLTLEGEVYQKAKRGIYGGASIAWSGGQPGVGIYLGPLTYSKGIPYTQAATQEPPELLSGRSEVETAIESIVRRAPIVVFSKTTCPYSKRAKKLLEEFDLIPPPFVVEVDQRSDTAEIKSTLRRVASHDTWPTIFIGGKMIGGSDDLQSLQDRKKLERMIHESGAFSAEEEY